MNIVLPEKEATDRWNINDGYSVYDRIGNPVQPQFRRHLIKNTVWEKTNLKYHMFLLHTRWNHREVSTVMNDKGKDDVFYFSIIREPVSV